MTTRSDAAGSAQHRLRPIAIALAALIVCIGATFAIGSQFFGWFSSSGWFNVESPESKAPVTRGAFAYVAGRTLYRPNKRPQRLARPLFPSPLRPDDTALAVASPDGRYVVYQTMRSKSPYPGETSFVQELYVHDTITQREKVLARGAHSAAWNRDGRIAYVKADHERYRSKYGEDDGQVVVQTLNGSPSKWTRRSNSYQVLAWAGDELLVEIPYCHPYSPGCREQPGAGVYALNRSGRLRPLNLAKWIALSPDGRYAFGVADRQVFNKELTWRVRISRVDTGKAVTTLNLARPLGPPDERSSFSFGFWRGNSIILAHGTSLVFLIERDPRLALESVISFPRLARMEYLWLVVPSSFSGPASERVVVAAHGNGHNVRYVEAALSCSRSKRVCVRTAYLPRDRSLGVFAVLANPSRP